MQPPTFEFVPLRTQVADLKRAVTHAAPARQTSHRDKLRDQIRAWLASMSPEQRKRRFTIEEIERLAGLTGKTGGRTAHHHIAQSLRAIEFDPRRDWTVAGRNKRYWIWSEK